MQLKVLAVATMLSLGAGSSFAVDTVVSLSGGTVGVGTFGATPTGTFSNDRFSDNFIFTTGQFESFFSSSITSIGVFFFHDITISSVSLRTGAGFGTVVGNYFGGYFGNFRGDLELWTFTAQRLASGIPTLMPNTTYAIHVEGRSNGISAYAGMLNVMPIPEPGTYALMLAGLGIVGFVARRRK